MSMDEAKPHTPADAEAHARREAEEHSPTVKRLKAQILNLEADYEELRRLYERSVLERVELQAALKAERERAEELERLLNLMDGPASPPEG
ncbi:hypothetical protein [Calidithermus chliarophilus]|uniref:hypothetical protein n=1 Tax=Calidithermus chliarophilus TaxID=52023 RepID=UPI0003F54818|nr:hypothetical protein [Calidithermus chliarophilus]